MVMVMVGLRVMVRVSEVQVSTSVTRQHQRTKKWNKAKQTGKRESTLARNTTSILR